MKLAVESDGGSHFLDDAREHDIRRQALIESTGITLLRLANQDVYDRLEGVIEMIFRSIPKKHLP